MGTNGGQLRDWCKNNKVEGFGGVYCASDLPRVFRPPNYGIIVNHSPCNSSGSHWLACRIKGDTAYWFDSYGEPPSAPLENLLMQPTNYIPPFKEWLIESGVNKVVYNNEDLQSVYTEVCGLYACYFLKYGLPNDPKNKKHWLFLTGDRAENDAIIKTKVRIKVAN